MEREQRVKKRVSRGKSREERKKREECRAEWTVGAAEITQMLEDNSEGGVWPLRGTSMRLAHPKWH